MVDCPGHFGYVDLEMPVYHVGFFKHAINILKSVCKDCSRILLTNDDKIKFYRQMKARKDPH